MYDDPQSSLGAIAETIRQACVEAALNGYEDALLSGLCREGAWEAAVSAIRRIDPGELVDDRAEASPLPEATPMDRSLQSLTALLARELASPGSPAAGSGAAATGAIAAGLLEWTAEHSERNGPASFRERARAIRFRAANIQQTLAAAAQHDAEAVRRVIDARTGAAPRESLDRAMESALEIASHCARTATLAAEVESQTRGALRPDVAVALQLASSASHCALRLFEGSLPAEQEQTELLLRAKRRAWRVRLLLHRAAPSLTNGLPESWGDQPRRRE